MTTSELTIEMFGGLRLRRNEKILCEFPPQQIGLLFAYLALHPDRTFTREEVIAWLLPDLEIEAGRHKLRQYLYALRRELAACSISDEHLLIITRNHIGLNSEAVRIDVVAFEAALRAASASTDVEERIQLLTSALALYRGELLPGFFGSDRAVDGIEAERRRLTDVHLNALMALANAHKQAGDLPRALEVMQRVIALDPLQEEAYCETMRLYAATGRLTAAQRQYQRLTEVLKEELNVEPSPEAQRLMHTLRLNAIEDAAPPVEALRPAVTSNPAHAEAVTSPTAFHFSPMPPESYAGNGRSGDARPAPASPMPSANLISRPRLYRSRLILAAALIVLMSVLLWRVRPHRQPAIPSPSIAGNVNDDIPQGTYGNEMWVTPMKEEPGDEGSEPTAVTTDEGGNIYIAGLVHTDKTVKHDVDYVTLKYDANGTQLWQARYNGPANDCDRAHAIAVDEAGNVYVTGESYNGDWEKGGTDYDVVTIKYDVHGKRSSTWPDVGYGPGVRRYDGAHRADWGKKIALDGAGNVYVGVTSSHLTASRIRCSDFTILKYDAYGNPSSTWPDVGNGVGIRRYNSKGEGQDDLNDMAVDASGNVTVTGVGRGRGHAAIVTLKYDAAGRRKWVQSYDGPGNGEDVGSCLTLDKLGNVYVAGYAILGSDARGGSERHIVTLKYSESGQSKWSAIDQNPCSIAGPHSIAVDPVGNVVVVGAAGPAMRVIVYDPNGWIRWSRYLYGRGYARVDCPPNSAQDVILDGGGSIYVVGSLFNGPGASDDYATLKFGINGSLHRLLLYDDSLHGSDFGTAIARDREGYLIVTGQAQGKSHRSITTLKYHP